MKYLALLLLAACAAEATKPPTPPPPPEFDRQYVLTQLSYEDVYPGNYAAKLLSFSGGPAWMEFGEGAGQLKATTAVAGVMGIVYPDGSSTSQAIAILSAGTIGFAFLADSSGALTFTSSSKLWAFAPGAILSDSTYTYDSKTCYDEGSRSCG
jgi:hypothetical protein